MTVPAGVAMEALAESRRPATLPALQPALASELEAGAWDFPWNLAPALTAPVSDAGARHAAWTLERMLEEPVRDTLATGKEGATALDLGCGEGRLAHSLLAWNAARVVGVETRTARLRRAELVRHHLGVSPSALELRGASDLRELYPAELGAFDVVLLVGVVDRVADSAALIRLARACTEALCVIETGSADLDRLAASARGAGFPAVTRAAPPPDGERRYVLGGRAVLIARAEPAR